MSTRVSSYTIDYLHAVKKWLADAPKSDADFYVATVTIEIDGSLIATMTQDDFEDWQATLEGEYA